jgi:hypothetical protein
MEEKNARNTLDTAVPRPADADRLSENEKKELELAALMEHEQGERKESLHDQTQELEKAPDDR